MMGLRAKVRTSAQNTGSSMRRQSGSSSGRVLKRKSWSRFGVSDIIANLLILAITVVLFSSIIMFVSSMPAPKPSTYGDFYATVDFETGEYVNVSIKHLGGEPLKNASTKIYLISDVGQVYANISDSRPSIGMSWNLGATWTFNSTSPTVKYVTSESRLEVMIVDTERNMVVWTGKLLGGDGTSIPVIMDRYLATNQGTSADPMWVRDDVFYKLQKVALFVNVEDSKGDVTSVKANISALSSFKNEVTMTEVQTGWYKYEFETIFNSYTPKNILITAVDAEGHKAVTTLKVYVYDAGNGNNNNTGPGNGSFPGNLYFSGLQGYNIFKYEDWLKYSWNSTPCTEFENDEYGIIVVASKFLVNTDNANILNVVGSSNRTIMTAASSPTVMFEPYLYYSGYYIYIAMLETPSLAPDSKYIVQMQLRDSWLPTNNIFAATEMISVGNSDIPAMDTFFDAACTLPSKNFATSQTIYVRVQDKYGGAWNQYGGTIELVDYFWNMPVKRIPNSVATNPQIVNPVSYVGKLNSTTYVFAINLTMANQDPWMPGNNSYMLRYDAFVAGTERYTLSSMIYIKASTVILDAVVGAPFTSHPGSVGTDYFLEYYRNNNNWLAPDYLEYKTQKGEGFSSIQFVRLGDMNHNGKNDIIAVYDGNLIYWYVNNGEWTRRAIEANGRGTISAIALGNVDISSGLEVIVGYNDGTWGYYRNDGLWTYVPVDTTTGDYIRSLQPIDTYNTLGKKGMEMSMDVVVGLESDINKMWIYRNADGVGNTWTIDKWSGGTSTVNRYSANGEYSINSYVPAGQSYADTVWTGSSQENVFTEPTSLKIDSKAYRWGADAPPLPIGSSLTWLNPQASQFAPAYVLPLTKIKFSTSWTTVGMFQIQGAAPVLKLTLPDSTVVNLITINAATGSQEVDITSYVTSETILTNLQFSITNNLKKGELHFTDWVLTVQFDRSVMAMNHIWTFPAIAAGSNAFHVYANVSTGGDTFNLEWSTNNITYTKFGSVTTTSMELYQFNLPITGAFSKVYIRAVNANPVNNVNSTLTVGRMCIYNVVSTTDTVAAVTSIQVYDMDNDGYKDIIINDNTRIWVLLNDATTGTFTITANVVKITMPVSTIKGVVPGVFEYGDKFPDLAVATGTGIYIVPHTARTTYGAPVMKLNGVVVNSALDVCIQSGDVDGDQDTDLVVGQGAMVTLYINGAGTFRAYTITNIAMVSSLYLGKTTG